MSDLKTITVTLNEQEGRALMASANLFHDALADIRISEDIDAVLLPHEPPPLVTASMKIEIALVEGGCSI
jgi:hypothetical protein